jgi:hypothetical protein
MRLLFYVALFMSLMLIGAKAANADTVTEDCNLPGNWFLVAKLENPSGSIGKKNVGRYVPACLLEIDRGGRIDRGRCWEATEEERYGAPPDFTMTGQFLVRNRTCSFRGVLEFSDGLICNITRGQLGDGDLIANMGCRENGGVGIIDGKQRRGIDER